MSRETDEHFHPVEQRMSQGEVMKLISLAEWIIANAEPAPDLYVDPALRGQWRRAREKWLTQANDLLL
jgi:mRNA-degrading endonuclease YafQ of YafQ-DinJ toxin-antitoxin module